MADETVKAKKSGKKGKRGPSVALATFWGAVLNGIKNKTADAEVAKSLNMPVESFELRRGQVGRNFALASGTYRVGEGETATELVGTAVMAKFNVPVAMLGKPADFKAKTTRPIECIKPGTNPITRSSASGAGRGRKSDWAQMMDLHANIIGAGEPQG